MKSEPPNEVIRSWRNLFLKFKGIIVFLGFVVSISLTVASWRALDDAQQLAADGAWVTGTVSDKRRNLARRSFSRYTLDIMYERDGVRDWSRLRVSRDIFNGHAIRSDIEVLASAKKRSLIELNQGDTFKKGCKLGVLAFVALVLSVCAVFTSKAPTNVTQLARDVGCSARATVTRITQAGGYRLHRRFPFFVRSMVLRFETADGLVGYWVDNDPSTLEGIDIGTEIDVFVHLGSVRWAGYAGREG